MNELASAGSLARIERLTAGLAPTTRDSYRNGHGPAMRPETETDKRGAGAATRRRDCMTFRARPKLRALPKRRPAVHEPRPRTAVGGNRSPYAGPAQA